MQVARSTPGRGGTRHQRNVDLTTDGLWAMPLNSGWVPVKSRRLQDWQKLKKYVPNNKHGDVGSKIVQTPKSLAWMLKNIVSYPPLTHAFLKWPFLTDFKKYTHTPPYGMKFWCSGRKMEKTLKIHEFAPRWHILNVPERYIWLIRAFPPPSPPPPATTRCLFNGK